jgi:ubiquilin
MLVSALKQLIYDRSSIPIERQRIIFQGRVLVDDKKISEYKIDDGHVLHMVAMPERQNQPQTTQTNQSQPQNSNQQNPLNGIFMNPLGGGNISSNDLGSVIF